MGQHKVVSLNNDKKRSPKAALFSCPADSQHQIEYGRKDFLSPCCGITKTRASWGANRAEGRELLGNHTIRF